MARTILEIDLVIGTEIATQIGGPAMRRLLSRFWNFLKGQLSGTGAPGANVEEARAVSDVYTRGPGSFGPGSF